MSQPRSLTLHTHELQTMHGNFCVKTSNNAEKEIEGNWQNPSSDKQKRERIDLHTVIT